MFKPYIKFITGILLFAWSSALSQEQQLHTIYLKTIASYQPVASYLTDRYIMGHKLDDSLSIKITTVDELQQIINSGLQHNVFNVHVQNTDNLDLVKTLDLLADFSHLTFLKLDDWSIGKISDYQLPTGIQKLQQLRGMEFRNTNKMDMSDAINKLAALKQLKVLLFTGYNYQLPANIIQLKNIELISLSPENIENADLRLTNWQSAYISGMDGTYNRQLNEKALLNLSRVPSLKRLDLSSVILNDATIFTQFNQINTLHLYSFPVSAKVPFFKQISPLKNLRSLLCHMVSDSISIDGIEGLENLQNLDLSSLKGFDQHPEKLNTLSHLKNLQSLSLHDFGLTSIPDIFTGLTRLKKINLAGNLLTQLPGSIFKLPELEYLNVSSNKLTTLPDYENYACENLKTLTIAINEIAVIPTAVTRLKQLEIFDASNNNIKLLPSGFFDLKKLKEIKLKSNLFATFPDGLQQMQSLENIDVSDNDISFIPDITGNNYRLKSLSVNGNKLISLPAHIGKYTELEFLNAGGNSLTSLPESLGECKKLKYLHVSSYNWTSVYKTGWEFSQRVIKDSTKHNDIKALPAGLKNAKDLEFLFLSGNPSINSRSVFDVILSVPRKRFRVDISHDNITELPASPQWALMTFDRLDLSYNKLTTLPVEFGSIKTFDINLSHSFIPADKAYNQPILTKVDMKVLYDDLGIDLPGIIVSRSEYAAALAARISDCYTEKKWAKAVEYAQKAIAADSVVYKQKVHWDEIGKCRFNVNDFTGAIKDLDRFIAREKTLRYPHFQSELSSVELYKSMAQLALGQHEQAANTHIYFSKNFNTPRSLQEAAAIYMDMGNKVRYSQLIDTALLLYQPMLEETHKKQQITTPWVFDYIELLIMAGKPTDAIDLINKEPSFYFSKKDLAIKNYLTATANYLIDNKLFDQLKKSLTASVTTTGKAAYWNYTLFNKWLSYSGLTPIQKEQLLALQNIAK